MIAFLFIGFAVGMGLSFQTSINGRLRRSVVSPFLTSLISFALSTLFIAAIALFSFGTELALIDSFAATPWWMWIGGMMGFIFLTGNIVLFPKLGAVQTVIFPVLGQVLTGIVVDQFGLFHAPTAPLGFVKFVGTVLALGGVLGVVLCAQKNQVAAVQGSALKLWGWRLLGIATGSCSAVQITINGQLGLVLHSSILAALASFIVGTLSLLLIVCIQRPKLKVSLPEGENRNPWWMWLGGLLGATYVIGNAFISPQLGTGLTVVVGLLGLMTAGLIVDQTGILCSPRHPVRLPQILCLLTMLAGVALIRIVA